MKNQNTEQQLKPVITDDLVPVSRYTRPGRPMKEVQAVVLHWTGNPGTTAKNNRDWMARIPEINITSSDPPLFASWHYTVGIKGEIIRQIPENETAYHAGGRAYTETAKKLFWDEDRKSVYPHDKCIGIEICHPDGSGEFTSATTESVILLTADIAERYNLHRSRILRHFDVTGKVCPKWFVDHPDHWERVLDMIAVYRQKMQK